MATAHTFTILSVDNERGPLLLRQALLENAGYKVFSVEDAARALQVFKSHTIDLVISDHLLPDVTGTDMTLKMKLERPFVPVMLFSGMADMPPGSDHADRFISKADGPVELLRNVADLLRCDRITEGNFFAEIRCDKRFNPTVWHYTIQRLRLNEILRWSQSFSEEGAIHAAKRDMRELNLHDASERKSQRFGH